MDVIGARMIATDKPGISNIYSQGYAQREACHTVINIQAPTLHQNFTDLATVALLTLFDSKFQM